MLFASDYVPIHNECEKEAKKLTSDPRIVERQGTNNDWRVNVVAQNTGSEQTTNNVLRQLLSPN